jgi:hypothetical protein
VVFDDALIIFVSYLAIARPDIQRAVAPSAEGRHSVTSTPPHLTGTPELDVE